MTRKTRCGSRRYGRTWRKARNEYKRYHPICECCKVAQAVEVHHIIPISEGGKHDKNNLMAVCRECHDMIHRKMREEKVERQRETMQEMQMERNSNVEGDRNEGAEEAGIK